MVTDLPDPPDISTRVDKTKKKTPEVLDLGVKLAKKWAEVYVDLYVKKGSDAAKAWARVFLPLEAHRVLMAEKAKELMVKRGIYKIPPPKDSA